MTDSLGVYISVPFCKAKCTYCNFASGVHGAGEHARYIARVCDELHGAGSFANEIDAHLPSVVGSVYLGGGTPSLLQPELLLELFACLRGEFEVGVGAEITVECAPGQISDPFLEAMLKAGVNRVSLGVQSFVDAEARATGRSHTGASAVAEISRLRAAGIAKINADLIAGLPGQTVASWRQSLEALAASGVDHASVYMLEVDEDSRLGRELIGGGARYGAGLVPGDDAIAAMYEEGCAFLQAEGLAQYEISNFARPGCESAHNRRYWERLPYLGLGLDASSMLRTQTGCAVRWGQTDDLGEYLTGEFGREARVLGAQEELEEAWFLGLRLNEGVSVAALRAEFGAGALAAYDDVMEQLAGDGLLVRDADRVRLTARGRMVSNDVFGEFLLGELTAV